MAQHSHHLSARAWYARPAFWIVGAILAAIAVFGVLQMGERPFALSYGEFLDQLQAGNIAAVTFSGTQIDGSFKKAVEQAGKSGPVARTTFRSDVPDFGDPGLLVDLHNGHVVIDVASSSGWVSWLAKLPWPMLLILGVLLLMGLSRLRSGDTGAQGTAVAAHSFSTLSRRLLGKEDRAVVAADRHEVSPRPTA
jgi:FtsH-like protein